ncbi:restriction endonuclease subunit S [Yersinia enterocolitica]|uniref:restriction endonuclease subunit S n=1 Tax=Yersinia enterocolitica TaxID=630 RepID=UPI001C8D75B5|nr:restriction endonuclease subunit S [Yersinia enterocolitica]MBX9474468.1 restriction endonuclease subunit S [Yersinia enterocolitica]
MSVNNKVPEIRFKGFSGEWKNKKIGRILAEIKRPIELMDNASYQLVTVKRRNEGVVPRVVLKGKNILVKNYFSVKAGDYLISKRQVVHGANGIVPDNLDGAVVSNEYLVVTDSDDITARYWTVISIRPEMHKLFFVSSYGVDIEKLVFDVTDWKNRTIVIPQITEQKNITDYFQKLDALINQHKNKHDKLSNIKKAMLEKMFPKQGETIPEIRFKGFSGEWEEAKLGEIGDTFTGLSGKTKDDFGHGQGRFVTYLNVFSNAISNENSVEPIEIDTNQNEVKKGDVFFTTSSETPEEVGMSSIWMSEIKNVYLNSFCFGYRPKQQFDSYYLAYMLRSNSFREKIVFLAQGISRYNISKTKVMDIKVSIPCLSEQEKIGNYFQKLDALINQHQQQIAKLNNIKQACLSKMFI